LVEKVVIFVGTDVARRSRVERVLRGDLALAGALDAPTDAGSHQGRPPDVCLLDAVDLDVDAAITGVALLDAAFPESCTVVIHDNSEPAVVRSILDAGALSIVPTTTSDRQLAATLEAATEGHGLIDVDMVRPVIDLYATLHAESRRRNRAVIESLAAAVEAKDTVTSRHLKAVSRLATQLARDGRPRLGDQRRLPLRLPAARRRQDRRAREDPHEARLADAGRVGGHAPPPADRRARRAAARPGDVVTDVVLHHHERWDGAGYPDGLAPRRSRSPPAVFSVCDALEAMTADRPYRGPLPASGVRARAPRVRPAVRSRCRRCAERASRRRDRPVREGGLTSSTARAAISSSLADAVAVRRAHSAALPLPHAIYGPRGHHGCRARSHLRRPATPARISRCSVGPAPGCRRTSNCHGPWRTFASATVATSSASAPERLPHVRPPHGAARVLRAASDMRRLTLLACASLALLAGACGGDDELTSQTPRTIPDLTIPTTPDDPGAGADDRTSTTGDDETDTTATDAADPATGGTGATSGATGGTAAGEPSTAAPVTPAPAPTPAAPEGTGGATGDPAPAPAEPEDTGGAAAGAGGNADFCANNPGAC
jgi:DNA-binding NarL/FixJ family response regulator